MGREDEGEKGEEGEVEAGMVRCIRRRGKACEDSRSMQRPATHGSLHSFGELPVHPSRVSIFSASRAVQRTVKAQDPIRKGRDCFCRHLSFPFMFQIIDSMTAILLMMKS